VTQREIKRLKINNVKSEARSQKSEVRKKKAEVERKSRPEGQDFKKLTT